MFEDYDYLNIIHYDPLRVDYSKGSEILECPGCKNWSLECPRFYPFHIIESIVKKHMWECPELQQLVIKLGVTPYLSQVLEIKTQIVEGPWSK